MAHATRTDYATDAPSGGGAMLYLMLAVLAIAIGVPAAIAVMLGAM